MPAYKMKQQKALHKGWHISYGVADGEVWTTNSYLAVRKKVTPEECKALKEQQDKRGEQALDLQPLYDAYTNNPRHLVNNAGKKLSNSTNLAVVYKGREEMELDGDMLMYLKALYDKHDWYVVEGKEQDYLGMWSNGQLVAMLAPIVKGD